MKTDTIYLNHILQRCTKIRRITTSLTKEQIFPDEDSQDIIIRPLENHRRNNNTAFVWGTATEDSPPLTRRIENLLNENTADTENV